MQLELGKGRPRSDNIEEETPVIHNINIDISHAFTQSLTHILKGWIVNQPVVNESTLSLLQVIYSDISATEHVSLYFNKLTSGGVLPSF